MAELSGNLWEWNLTKVVVVDVTDDYRYMLAPMPGSFYPVVKEIWLPSHRLAESLQSVDLAMGYLYDWHETPERDGESWYVGVVDAQLTQLRQSTIVATVN